MVQNNETKVIIGRLEPSFLKVLEDAKRWRKLHQEDPDATIYEEFNTAIEELKLLQDKLEAVKIHFDLVDKHRNDLDDLPEYHAYRHILNSTWFTKFREILGGVDIDEGHI